MAAGRDGLLLGLPLEHGLLLRHLLRLFDPRVLVFWTGITGFRLKRRAAAMAVGDTRRLRACLGFRLGWGGSSVGGPLYDEAQMEV